MVKAAKPFKPGDRCNRKGAPHCPGRILRADPDAVDAAGHKKKGVWVVEFDVAATGEKSIEQGISSRMLTRSSVEQEVVNRPTVGNAYVPIKNRPCRTTAVAAVPSLLETDASSSHNEKDAAESSSNDSDDGHQEEEAKKENGPANNAGRSQLLLNDSLDREEEELFAESEEEEEEQHPTPPSNTSDDELEEEDIPGGEIPVEPENIHRARWEQYKINKAQLLSDGWEVSKTSGSNEGVAIGARVSTRAQRNRREGTVVGQTEVDGKKHWLVDFGGEEAATMRPLQLIIERRSEAQQYVWTLVEDSLPLENTASEEYTEIGLAGFDFPELFKPPTGETSYEYPYLKLFQTLWPGDWKHQLRQLNLKVAAENAANSGKKNWRNITPVSQREWWTFIGILVSAGPHGKGGNKLWERSSTTYDGFCGMTQPINYGPSGLDIMAEYRFNDIKACFAWSFQDKSKEPTYDEDGNAIIEDDNGKDPWHMVMLMVDGYNKVRHELVAASVCKVLDESMSAFRPRTTPKGGLPHLSFILRKPEPLGTEFKVIACAVTGKLPSKSTVCCRLCQGKRAMVDAFFRLNCYRGRSRKSRIWAAVAAPRVISAVFAQHIKPLIFDGLPPVNNDSLVESYRDFVPGKSNLSLDLFFRMDAV
jgi:hypothetical protein